MLFIRPKLVVVVLFLVIVILSLGPEPVPAFAQTASAPESDALKDDIERIKADLEEIKKLKLVREFLVQRLSQPAPPAPVVA